MKESYRINRLLRDSKQARDRAATLCVASCPSGEDSGYAPFDLFKQGVEFGAKAGGDFGPEAKSGYGQGEIWYAGYQDLFFWFLGQDDDIFKQLTHGETEEEAAAADLEFLTWLEEETKEVTEVEYDGTAEGSEGAGCRDAHQKILAKYREFLSPTPTPTPTKTQVEIEGSSVEEILDALQHFDIKARITKEKVV